ncbi:uncharacterized protein Osi16 [Chironomus tepperi]|uniref:uncharacterized protein Osi16 n=1 Tax=Chironomus tepperi TaxID=113505 RepID=UPI00391FC6D9
MKAKCESSYNLMCLKLDVISLIDRISAANTEYQLTSGISLVREHNVNKTQNAKIVSELARAFPDSAEKRLNGFLVAKVQEFLSSFALRFKLLNDDVASEVESSRKGGYGGGGDGFGKKGGGGILAMALMMKGAMGAMAMGAVAALAGKALLTGMMALTLAGIVALKALTSKGEKKTTYEIISKPVYSHSHSYSTGHGSGHGGGGHSHEEHGAYGGGYGRSFTEFKLPESVKA